MAPVVRYPEVVLVVNSQSVWVCEQSLTNTAQGRSTFVVFGQHRTGTLERKNVSLRIQCHSRSFSHTHSIGCMKEIRNYAVAQGGDRIKCSRIRRTWNVLAQYW